QVAQSRIRETQTLIAESGKLFVDCRVLCTELARRQSGARILLVDGDAIRRADQADDLRDRGYGIVEAGDVIDARTLLAKQRIDLIITEVDLPGPSKVPVIKILPYRDVAEKVHPITASTLAALVECLLLTKKRHRR